MNVAIGTVIALNRAAPHRAGEYLPERVMQTSSADAEGQGKRNARKWITPHW
jgi:hypothetical protein